MTDWTEGFSLESRSQGVLTADQARSQLEFILSHLSYLTRYADLLDELNADVYTTEPLKVVGYMVCRDELIGTPLWNELSDEVKCRVIMIDDESIEMLLGAVLDGVMAEYDATGLRRKI
jgi:hypothetical protein